MPCMYREGENCTLMNKPCFGKRFDPESNQWYFDEYFEKACPVYKPRDTVKVELPKEVKAPCKYREESLCVLTNQTCVGFVFDEVTGRWYFDELKEKTCKNYQASEIIDERFKPKTLPLEKEEKIKKEGKVIVRIFGRGSKYYYIADESDEYVDYEDVHLYADIIENYLKRKFGDQVIVEAIDVTSSKIDMFPKVKEILMKGGMFQFVVMINDEIKFVGDISPVKIKEELKKLGLKEIEEEEE